MGHFRIYLDNCCLNRPYDDQTHETIRLETGAKLYVQNEIRRGEIELAWSFMIDFENSENPNVDEKEMIAEWKHLAKIHVAAADSILRKGRELESTFGIRAKDALHVACAMDGRCGHFLTTDKQLLRKFAGNQLYGLRILNPIQFIYQMEEETP